MDTPLQTGGERNGDPTMTGALDGTPRQFAADVERLVVGFMDTYPGRNMEAKGTDSCHGTCLECTYCFVERFELQLCQWCMHC